MSYLDKYRQQLEIEAIEAKKAMQNRRAFIEIEQGDFAELFVNQATVLMRSRNRWEDFTIDDQNKELIESLYLYIFGSDQFKGDIHKGILITGPIGTGKTLIMSTFSRIVSELSRKIITNVHAKDLEKILRDPEKGIQYLARRPLFIDDLGKESTEVQDYGTVIRPAVDVLTRRYDNGAWTFATANFTMDTFSQIYGETITSRFREMFNVIHLPGKDRRKA